MHYLELFLTYVCVSLLIKLCDLYDLFTRQIFLVLIDVDILSNESRITTSIDLKVFCVIEANELNLLRLKQDIKFKISSIDFDVTNAIAL